jgi:DNA-binding CsgD family transcriptional regulator
VSFVIDEGEYLAHYGTPRHSGRYPWGSGGEDNGSVPRTAGFLDHVAEARRQGLSDTEIARGMGMTTTQFRARNSAEKNAAKQADIAMAQRLKDKGMSTSAIGRQMGRNESSVRALLEPGAKEKTDRLQGTVNMLKEQVDAKGLVDVGKGVEYYIGVGRQTLDTAVAHLRDALGYSVIPLQVPQLGTGGNQKTNMKVLAPPGTTYRDAAKRVTEVQSLYDQTTDDGGRTYFGILPPKSISSKRVGINYAEDGGSKADGVIYVRPGVEDVSLGGSRYAQVRIAVDGSHYIKGMAMYKDDLPDGVDIVFNTNKKSTGNKLDALKPMAKGQDGKIDPDNPFGAVISRQIGPIDPKSGKPKHLTSAMNIVNEEGNWDTWSRNLSSQFLSKQSPTLIKSQLEITQQNKKADFDEIMSLTNPVVRKALLEKFADSADAAAVHLKAAQLPRQSSHVILPITSIKETEVYAPNFRDGERVVLVRYPHAGTFEIPELTVNNKNREAKRAIGSGEKTDAIGIHHKVAERLSGADFDGDSVIVIPQRAGAGKVKTSSPLQGLAKFDAKASYPKYDGMKVMDARTKGIEMGKVSNLITDMSLQGASHEELVRAVRHSMVVIDAEKHELNYRQSFIDNGIADLYRKYQKSAQGGASTLISRAGSTLRVPEAKPRKASQGGPIDPRTGKKVLVPTGAMIPNRKTGQLEPKTMKVKKLEFHDDANKLLSKNGGTVQERLYAEHSNKMKALANQARYASVRTPKVKVSPSAKVTYSSEVKTLSAKLRTALENAPLERQALVIANRVYQAKLQAAPNMDDVQKKRVKYQSLQQARLNTGAGKTRIEITDREWEAIQAGAISHSRLEQILLHANAERIQELATPKQKVLMTSAKTQRALSMLASGYTQAEIASALGVSLSTLKRNLSGGE